MAFSCAGAATCGAAYARMTMRIPSMTPKTSSYTNDDRLPALVVQFWRRNQDPTEGAAIWGPGRVEAMVAKGEVIARSRAL